MRIFLHFNVFYTNFGANNSTMASLCLIGYAKMTLILDNNLLIISNILQALKNFAHETKLTNEPAAYDGGTHIPCGAS